MDWFTWKGIDTQQLKLVNTESWLFLLVTPEPENIWDIDQVMEYEMILIVHNIMMP